LRCVCKHVVVSLRFRPCTVQLRVRTCGRVRHRTHAAAVALVEQRYSATADDRRRIGDRTTRGSRSHRKRRKRRGRRDRVSSVGVVRFDSRPANRADFRGERCARRRRGRATTRVQSATDRAPVGGQYCRLSENVAPIGLYFLRAAVFCDLSAHRDARGAVLRRPQLSNDAGSMYKRRENETETVASPCS